MASEKISLPDILAMKYNLKNSSALRFDMYNINNLREDYL